MTYRKIACCGIVVPRGVEALKAWPVIGTASTASRCYHAVDRHSMGIYGASSQQSVIWDFTIKQGRGSVRLTRNFLSNSSIFNTISYQTHRTCSIMDSQKIYSEVSERYSAAARGSNTGFGDTIAKAFGYSEEELAGIPKDSNMGLSCGNPLAIATLRDVGSQ